MAIKIDPNTLTRGTLIEVQYGSRGTQIARVLGRTPNKVQIDRFNGRVGRWMSSRSSIDQRKVLGLAEESDPRTVAARAALAGPTT